MDELRNLYGSEEIEKDMLTESHKNIKPGAIPAHYKIA